ncbi:DNA primase [Salmonella enterica subsp. enterica serovar Weybridge]|nr:DNA primase [Salmonella enterica subsp. enterica serovar Weybridge]
MIAQHRMWLAVPHEEREEAMKSHPRLENGQNAIGWDKELKLWYARPGTEMSLLENWIPKPQNFSMNDNDPVVEFQNILEKAGFILPKGVDMDGKVHRVATKGDKDDKTSGAYKAFLDGRPAGWYQDHRSTEGVVKWTYSGGLDANPLARLHLRASAQQNRDDEARALKVQHDKQAQYAQSYVDKWPQAENNEYLNRKGVNAAPGVRINDKDELIIPFSNSDGETRSYQRIPLTGGKDARILKGSEKSGNWFPLGEPVNGQPILFAEGYATAASIHEGTGLPVLMTIDGGNMVTVAENAHKKWPDSPLLFCADNDHHLEQRAISRGITDEAQIKAQNKGIISAESAAKVTGGKIISPQFTEVEKRKELTDFNDLDMSRGREIFREIINTQLYELGISTQFNKTPDIKMELDNLAPPPTLAENMTMDENKDNDSGSILRSKDGGPDLYFSDIDPTIDRKMYEDYEASLDNHITLASQNVPASTSPISEDSLGEPPAPIAETPFSVPAAEIPEATPASVAADLPEQPAPAAEITTGTTAPDAPETAPASPAAASQPEQPAPAAETSVSSPVPDAPETTPASPAAASQPEQPAPTAETSASAPAPDAPETAPVSPAVASQPEQPAPATESTLNEPAQEAPEVKQASDKSQKQPAADKAPDTDTQEESHQKSWGERLDHLLGKFGYKQRTEITETTEKKTEDKSAPEQEVKAPQEADAIVYAPQRPGRHSLENLDELRKSLKWDFDEKKRTTLYKVDGEPSFTDFGNRFEMVDGTSKDDRKVLAALAVSTHLYGGVIELTGSDEFKDKAMRLIVEYDIQMRMTSPVQREQLEAIRKEMAGTGDAIVTHQPTPDLNRHTQDSPSPEQPVPPAASASAIDTPPAAAVPGTTDTFPQATVPPENPVAPTTPAMTALETKNDAHEEPAPGKLSPGQSVTAILEDFGQKEYVNGDKKGYSYFVELKNRSGSYTYWGQDLEKLVEGRQPGDVVKLTLDSREKWGLPGEKENRVRNKWSMELVSPGIAVPHDQPEQGQKITAFSTATFLQLNEQIQQGWPDHIQGLKLPAAVDQFVYLREDRHAATQPVIDPKLPSGTDEPPLHLTPVMASLDKETQQLNLLLVQGAGEHLQGVARLNGTLYPVLATPTADNQQLVINALTENGLRFAGYGQAVNEGPGMNNHAGPQLMQFHLKGHTDDAPLSARLYTPEKQPAEMFQRLGFEQTWQQWTDSQKQQDRQEKTLHQEHSHNPGR